jgi:multiple sugar transport system substrate-binding protein
MGEYDDRDDLAVEGGALDRRTLLEKAAAAGAAIAAGGLLTGGAGAAPSATPGDVTFFSTQLNTVSESEAFRRVLLQGFAGRVDSIFAASDAVFINRIDAERQAGRGTIDLLGALHGTYVTLQDKNQLLDLSDVVRPFLTGKNAINPEYIRLGKLGTNRQLYVPWMQATYVVSARRGSASPRGPTASSTASSRATSYRPSRAAW